MPPKRKASTSTSKGAAASSSAAAARPARSTSAAHPKHNVHSTTTTATTTGATRHVKSNSSTHSAERSSTNANATVASKTGSSLVPSPSPATGATHTAESRRADEPMAPRKRAQTMSPEEAELIPSRSSSSAQTDVPSVLELPQSVQSRAQTWRAELNTAVSRVSPTQALPLTALSTSADDAIFFGSPTRLAIPAQLSATTRAVLERNQERYASSPTPEQGESCVSSQRPSASLSAARKDRRSGELTSGSSSSFDRRHSSIPSQLTFAAHRHRYSAASVSEAMLSIQFADEEDEEEAAIASLAAIVRNVEGRQGSASAPHARRQKQQQEQRKRDANMEESMLDTSQGSPLAPAESEVTRLLRKPQLPSFSKTACEKADENLSVEGTASDVPEPKRRPTTSLPAKRGSDEARGITDALNVPTPPHHAPSRPVEVGALAERGQATCSPSLIPSPSGGLPLPMDGHTGSPPWRPPLNSAYIAVPSPPSAQSLALSRRSSTASSSGTAMPHSLISRLAVAAMGNGGGGSGGGYKVPACPVNPPLALDVEAEEKKYANSDAVQANPLPFTTLTPTSSAVSPSKSPQSDVGSGHWHSLAPVNVGRRSAPPGEASGTSDATEPDSRLRTPSLIGSSSSQAAPLTPLFADRSPSTSHIRQSSQSSSAATRRRPVADTIHQALPPGWRLQGPDTTTSEDGVGVVADSDKLRLDSFLRQEHSVFLFNGPAPRSPQPGDITCPLPQPQPQPPQQSNAAERDFSSQLVTSAATSELPSGKEAQLFSAVSVALRARDLDEDVPAPAAAPEVLTPPQPPLHVPSMAAFGSASHVQSKRRHSSSSSAAAAATTTATADEVAAKNPADMNTESSPTNAQPPSADTADATPATHAAASSNGGGASGSGTEANLTCSDSPLQSHLSRSTSVSFIARPEEEDAGTVHVPVTDIVLPRTSSLLVVRPRRAEATATTTAVAATGGNAPSSPASLASPSSAPAAASKTGTAAPRATSPSSPLATANPVAAKRAARQQALAESFRNRIQVGVKPASSRKSAVRRSRNSRSGSSSSSSGRQTASDSSGGHSRSSTGRPSSRQRGGSIARRRSTSMHGRSGVSGSGGRGSSVPLTHFVSVAIIVFFLSRLIAVAKRMRAEQELETVTRPRAAFVIQCAWRAHKQRERVGRAEAVAFLVPWVRHKLRRLRRAKEASARLIQRVFRGQRDRSFHRFLYDQMCYNRALATLRHRIGVWESRNTLQRLKDERDERNILIQQCEQGTVRLLRLQRQEWADLMRDAHTQLHIVHSFTVAEWAAMVEQHTGFNPLVSDADNDDDDDDDGERSDIAKERGVAEEVRTDTAQKESAPSLAEEDEENARASVAMTPVYDCNGSATRPTRRREKRCASVSAASTERGKKPILSFSGAAGIVAGLLVSRTSLGKPETAVAFISKTLQPESARYLDDLFPYVTARHRGLNASVGHSLGGQSLLDAPASPRHDGEDEENESGARGDGGTVPGSSSTSCLLSSVTLQQIEPVARQDALYCAFVNLLESTEATSRRVLEQTLLSQHRSFLLPVSVMNRVMAIHKTVPPLYAPLLFSMKDEEFTQRAATLFRHEQRARLTIIAEYEVVPLHTLDRPQLCGEAEVRRQRLAHLSRNVAAPLGLYEAEENEFFRKVLQLEHRRQLLSTRADGTRAEAGLGIGWRAVDADGGVAGSDVVGVDGHKRSPDDDDDDEQQRSYKPIAPLVPVMRGAQAGQPSPSPPLLKGRPQRRFKVVMSSAPPSSLGGVDDAVVMESTMPHSMERHDSILTALTEEVAASERRRPVGAPMPMLRAEPLAVSVRSYSGGAFFSSPSVGMTESGGVVLSLSSPRPTPNHEGRSFLAPSMPAAPQARLQSLHHSHTRRRPSLVPQALPRAEQIDVCAEEGGGNFSMFRADTIADEAQEDAEEEAAVVVAVNAAVQPGRAEPLQTGFGVMPPSVFAFPVAAAAAADLAVNTPMPCVPLPRLHRISSSEALLSLDDSETEQIVTGAMEGAPGPRRSTMAPPPPVPTRRPSTTPSRPVRKEGVILTAPAVQPPTLRALRQLGLVRRASPFEILPGTPPPADPLLDDVTTVKAPAWHQRRDDDDADGIVLPTLQITPAVMRSSPLVARRPRPSDASTVVPVPSMPRQRQHSRPLDGLDAHGDEGGAGGSTQWPSPFHSNRLSVVTVSTSAHEDRSEDTATTTPAVPTLVSRDAGSPRCSFATCHLNTRASSEVAGVDHMSMFDSSCSSSSNNSSNGERLWGYKPAHAQEGMSRHHTAANQRQSWVNGGLQAGQLPSLVAANTTNVSATTVAEPRRPPTPPPRRAHTISC